MYDGVESSVMEVVSAWRLGKRDSSILDSSVLLRRLFTREASSGDLYYLLRVKVPFGAG